jgi:hypothetical protein
LVDDENSLMSKLWLKIQSSLIHVVFLVLLHLFLQVSQDQLTGVLYVGVVFVEV